MAIIDYRPQGKGTLGSYIRFAPGHISTALQAEGLGCILYYGVREKYAYADITGSNLRAIELIPGMEENQEATKAITLSRMPGFIDQEAREVIWMALQGGRRDKH